MSGSGISVDLNVPEALADTHLPSCSFVYQSTNIEYTRIKIKSISANASAPASNTDGWDIYRSSYVSISNSHVVNGDDCVSFKPNSTYMTVENMNCK